MDLDCFKKIAKINYMLLPAPAKHSCFVIESRIIVHLSLGCLDKVTYLGSSAVSSHTLKTLPHIWKDAVPALCLPVEEHLVDLQFP